MELGAGYGPWLVAGAIAARRRGIQDIRLYGVEAELGNYQAMRDHFVDNGIDPALHHLYHGAAGRQDGTLYWPLAPKGEEREHWGGRPQTRQNPELCAVRAYSLAGLLRNEAIWDLLHLDVQGDELTLLESCLPELKSRVRRLVIGTHSRKIEGDVLSLLYGEKFILEHEKPAKFLFSPKADNLEAMTLVDGTQVWFNPNAGSPASPVSVSTHRSVAEVVAQKFRVQLSKNELLLKLYRRFKNVLGVLRRRHAG